MGRTFMRQATQVMPSEVYDDTIAPTLAAYETNPADIEDDLNNLRSQLQNFLNRNGASFPAGNWYDDLTAPSTLEAGTARGIDAVNDGLHAVEKKRILRGVTSLVDITVPAAQNYVILALSELPANTTAAVGAVTTLGSVVAFHSGTFGTHSLDEVSGATAISPKNLVEIVDASTRDPILDSGGERIWALIQTETATDGHTMTGTTPNRAQLSFVKVNATGDDLEAVAAGDIATKVVNCAFPERVRFEDLNEQDFLRGAIVDVPSGATVTRQVAYDNQGTTPVDLTTNATLDLEGAGLAWTIRDDLEAALFQVVEGSAGGTSQVNIGADVDEFDVDAAVVDFAEGITVDSGGTALDIGATSPGVITSAGLLTLATTGADLTLDADGDLIFEDANYAGSTYDTPLNLSDSSAEWDLFETNFGEVSLLNALNQAYSHGARGTKAYASVTANISADTDVGGVGGGTNLDAQLPDMSGGTFLTDYDVFVNGQLMRPGADAAANNDYYPGTSLANGQLRFEFSLRLNPTPDVICVIPYS